MKCDGCSVEVLFGVPCPISILCPTFQCCFDLTVESILCIALLKYSFVNSGDYVHLPTLNPHHPPVHTTHIHTPLLHT